MEENWLFSTPTVFNTETASLNGQNKVAKEIGCHYRRNDEYGKTIWS